jgi:hypothetical protein
VIPDEKIVLNPVLLEAFAQHDIDTLSGLWNPALIGITLFTVPSNENPLPVLQPPTIADVEPGVNCVLSNPLLM